MRLRTSHVGVAVLLLGLLSACAAPDSGGGVAQPTPTLSPAAGATELSISVAPSKTAKPETWTLTCQPDGGTLPKVAQACAFVNRSATDVLAPAAPGHMCSQIYGGPQVATVKGRWRGKPVDARFSRVNGCEVARWDQVKSLLGDAGN